MINKLFIRFRFRQIIKFIREMPLLYLLLFLFLAGMGGIACFRWIEITKNSYILSGILLVSMLYCHMNRKDFHFIYLIDEKPSRVFLMDYFLFSLPFLLLEVFQYQWFAAGGLIMGSIIISFLPQPFHKVSPGVPVIPFIPAKAFELRSNFRKYGWIVILLYTGAWAGLFIPYLTFGFIWLYTACFCSAYSHAESKAILCSEEKTPTEFLRSKIGLNTLLYTITILPLCILYIFLYPSVWWLALYIWIAGVLTISLFIVIKYTFYKPGDPVRNGQFATSIAFLSILIPPLQILTILFLIKYTFSAEQNLKRYLYAYGS